MNLVAGEEIVREGAAVVIADDGKVYNSSSEVDRRYVSALGSGREGRITIIVDLPWMKKPEVREIALSPEQILTLAPLPRGHDDPLDIDAIRIARQVRDERTPLIRRLAEMSHDALHNVINSGDPMRGYDRNER